MNANKELLTESSAILLVSLLIILTLFFQVGPAPGHLELQGANGESFLNENHQQAFQPGSVSAANGTGSTPVRFELLNYSYVHIVYVSTIEVSSGNIHSGKSLNATIVLSNSTAEVTVNVPKFKIGGIALGGESANMTINPLGSHDVPIPGLYYNYSALSLSGGIYLNFTGSVTGTLSIEGNGTGSNGTFSWTSPGSKDVPITAPSDSSGKIIITLDSLHYDLLVTLYASYDLAGFSGKQQIVSGQAIHPVPGDPSSVNGVYNIITPDPFVVFFEQIDSYFLHNVTFSVIAIVIIVAAVIIAEAKKRKNSP